MSLDPRAERRRPSLSSPRRDVLMAGAAGLIAAAALPGGEAAAHTAPSGAGRHGGTGGFAGKTVLITGATSGIGKATAYAFAKEGARVMFCGRRTELGRSNEREIRDSGGEASFRRADVREESDVAALVTECVRHYGRIDIAVNNAGIETPRPSPLHQQSVRDFDAVWRTNARGVFLSMKYELPRMLSQRRGVIINTASISAEAGFATIAPYSASKHAVASLTKVAALEYADKGIRVNALAPGAVDTPMLRRAAEAFGTTYAEIAQDYPIKRIVHPDEIARVIMFLASDEASAVVGTDVDASGGYLTG
ncbi:SDR family NAD(P)-dependent oxidoreductase [Nonomuraea sp. 3N208]|uniref:SDR family NAD(P)-dependent oxidoreductase n=1 Tax=Nonomuraea sp. 3N208 TaxID=3457421 RepID=UPI003FCD2DCF